jgi:hypothetical protein
MLLTLACNSAAPLDNGRLATSLLAPLGPKPRYRHEESGLALEATHFFLDGKCSRASLPERELNTGEACVAWPLPTPYHEMD